MSACRLACLGVVATTWLALSSGCSSSDNGGGGGGNPDAGGDVPTSGGAFSIEVACTDGADAIYADPGDVSAKAKGAILKCHQDADISKSDLLARAKMDEGSTGYAGPDFTSGAHVYRVLYRTERANGQPGYSSAIVYVPDTPRAAKLPVLVASHGSRGQAAKCAPSKQDPAASDVEGDFHHQVYPLVGGGYVVMAPDLAGYANYGGANNPPSGYASAADVGKSTLDGARALRNMFSKSVTDDVVITGHSQGGHTALSALAMSDSYGAGGTVAAVVLYAPLWLPARAYAALFNAPTAYKVATSSAPKVSFWYHYTTAALLDGPDHALDVFVQDPAKRMVLKNFVDNDCWSSDYPDLDAAFTLPNDAFDPTYVNAIKSAAGPMDSGCNGDALCQKWMDRFNGERPHLAGHAQTVPILLNYGGMDTTITPDLEVCVFDRLKNDNANFKVCYDQARDHSTIVSTQASRVNDWIASKVLGGAAPPDCAADQTAINASCNNLIINNED